MGKVMVVTPFVIAVQLAFGPRLGEPCSVKLVAEAGQVRVMLLPFLVAERVGVVGPATGGARTTVFGPALKSAVTCAGVKAPA